MGGFLGGFTRMEHQMKLSRYDRPRKATRMQFTERDGQVVTDLLQIGPLRADHIQQLRFTKGGASRCQRRLTLLYRNRYIDKLPDQPVNAPDTYFISRNCSKGMRYLEQRFGVETVARRLRTPGKVEHSLMINECRIALVLGVRAAGFDLVEWKDEIDLAWMGAEVGFVPDAYFKIRRNLLDGPKTAAFFFEAERTARSNSAVDRRLDVYWNYLRSGRYEAKFGTRALRVLTVLATNENQRPMRRLIALAKRAEAAGATFFRFTTMEEFRGLPPEVELFAPIWRCPGEARSMPLFESL
jgi:hypothetical protein